MNDLLDVVFTNADSAHRQHLASESFAEHEALSEFYADVRDAADAFTEAAIGLDVAPPDGSTDIVGELEAGLIDLSQMRDQVCQGNNTLLNKFDELTGVYAKALFKLKRLA